MNVNIHYGDTCEIARLLMKNLESVAAKNLIADAMELTRSQLKKETPMHEGEYWRYHPNDLAAALVELLVK